jgi:ABC-type bacteriocin/lantibiotic exporter with double-glycine peptidase domain
LGLLKPTIGKLIVDGVQINEKNVKSFQDIVGYVPQSPTFIDDTIKKNIAFGVEDKEIDNKLIESSINQANLKEFLNTQKNGVNTIIGEKGVRISGGQKQRISIARALYKNPEILIFDEATSSLDEKNESEIINNISLVKDNKTIVVIAHKLSILENCDKILKLKEGKIYE